MRNVNFDKETNETKKNIISESENIIVRLTLICRKTIFFFQLKIIELFCKNGANLNEESNDHLFPLSIALKNNHKIANILLTYDSLDLTLISHADTCVFHEMAGLLNYRTGREIFYKTIELLKKKNVKIDSLINLVDNLGFTPLLKIIQAFSLNGKK